MLLFAKSREELERMMVSLIEVLEKIGLELNASKTKIITNDIHSDNFIMVGTEQISIIEDDGKHKYLGRYIPGVLENRASIEISHRIQCAWHQFGKHSSTLTNKNVTIKLRLRLFDATVTPSALFGLCALPISKQNMKKLMVCQRKMLRKIVGWVRHPGDEWETVMHNMKSKMNTAMHQFFVRPWDVRIIGARVKNFERIQLMDDYRWEKLSMQWDPNVVDDESQEYVPYRNVGRPILRWTDPVGLTGNEMSI